MSIFTKIKEFFLGKKEDVNDIENHVSFKESGTFFDKKRKNTNDELQNVSLQNSCGCCCHGNMRKIDLLDKGEVELLGVFGTDLTVVNAARVSFGNRKSSLSNEDIKLTGYLADNKHYSPFRHIMIRFRIKAPEFVMRQLYKHIVGIEVTASYPTKDHAWNEISGRYKPVEDFYYPTEWRKQSKNNKQASNGLIEDQQKANELFMQGMNRVNEIYHELLDLGVAKEQARILLPLNQYTEVYWTASFQAVANLIELRDHDHAQLEIREFAKAIATITQEQFPHAYKAWFNRKGV